MSFETEAKLSIEIPSSELRNARQQIESEIGTTEIGVTDGGSMSAQAAGGSGGGRERRRRRREYRWARERTDLAEETVMYLESIEDKVGGGGGGIIGEAIGGFGIGGAGLLSGILGPAIGSAVGSAVGDAIGDDGLGVEEPDWTPIDVDHPEEPYDVDHPEGPYDLDHPEEPYALDHPEEPYALDHPEEPYALDHPEEPYLIEDIGPLEVEEIDPIEISVDVTTGASGTSTAPVQDTSGDESTSVFEDLRPQRERTRERTEDIPIIGEPFADADRWVEDKISGGQEWLDGFQKDLFGGDDSSSDTSTASPSQRPRQTTTVNATVDPSPIDVTVNQGDINVDASDIERVVDEVQKANEDQIEDLRDDLEREIDDLERQIQGR